MFAEQPLAKPVGLLIRSLFYLGSEKYINTDKKASRHGVMQITIIKEFPITPVKYSTIEQSPLSTVYLYTVYCILYICVFLCIEFLYNVYM